MYKEEDENGLEEKEVSESSLQVNRAVASVVTVDRDTALPWTVLFQASIKASLGDKMTVGSKHHRA